MKHFTRNLTTHQSRRYIGTITNTPEGIQLRKQLRKVFRDVGEIKSNGRSKNRKSLIGKLSKTGHQLAEDSIRSFVPTEFATTLDLYITFFPTYHVTDDTIEYHLRKSGLVDMTEA